MLILIKRKLEKQKKAILILVKVDLRGRIITKNKRNENTTHQDL